MKNTSQRARADLRVQPVDLIRLVGGDVQPPVRDAGDGLRTEPLDIRPSISSASTSSGRNAAARARRARGTRSGNPRRRRRHQSPAGAFEACRERWTRMAAATRGEHAVGRKGEAGLPDRLDRRRATSAADGAEAHPVQRIVGLRAARATPAPHSAPSAASAGIDEAAVRPRRRPAGSDCGLRSSSRSGRSSDRRASRWQRFPPRLRSAGKSRTMPSVVAPDRDAVRQTELARFVEPRQQSIEIGIGDDRERGRRARSPPSTATTGLDSSARGARAAT